MIAQRSHGNRLQKRWNGTGIPPVHQTQPLQGCPALETTHPFHFKMTPGIMLGPSCNHDLGILLRCPSSVESANQALTSMLESMGDHEFYCASYSSKDQPHIEGLLLTLSDGLQCKLRDIMVAKEKGEDFTSHEICRKLLHNLLASTNRRMHKGFPEMLTYLLRNPMEYCSHQFVQLVADKVFRQAFAELLSMSSQSHAVRPLEQTLTTPSMQLYSSHI